MKVITMQQPWAWAIMHAGKDIENRSWSTPFRGRFYVHAGQSIWRGDADWLVETGLCSEAQRPVMEQAPRGAIIGSVELVTVIDADSRDADGNRWLLSNWALDGMYRWLLQDPKPLAEPIPVKGRQGWWNYDEQEVA